MIKFTSEVCDHQPDNVKALYKRAIAYKSVHDYDNAVDDMARAVDLDSSLQKAAEKFYKEINTRRTKDDKQDSNIFRNMLQISK